jgi:hypothetical protein
MNNKQKKEEVEIINILQSQKNGVRPSEELLRSALDKLPVGVPIKSPYAGYLSYFKKFGVASVALVMLIVGGVFFGRYESGGTSNSIAQVTKPITQPTENENSALSSKDTDTALEQDMNAVDAQLNGLNMDTANVDSSLNSRTS